MSPGQSTGGAVTTEARIAVAITALPKDGFPFLARRLPIVADSHSFDVVVFRGLACGQTCMMEVLG
jgi:hypothetical protein